MANLPVYGNTYPHRDAIKTLGGKWDGAKKLWFVPVENIERARALVNGEGGTTEHDSYRQNSRRKSTFHSRTFAGRSGRNGYCDSCNRFGKIVFDGMCGGCA